MEPVASKLEDTHLLMNLFFILYNHLSSHTHTHSKGPSMQKALSSAAVSRLFLPCELSSSVITAACHYMVATFCPEKTAITTAAASPAQPLVSLRAVWEHRTNGR